MQENMPPTKVSPALGMEVIHKMVRKADRQAIQIYEAMPCDLPGDQNRPKVTRKDINNNGVDGNNVKLHVFRRNDSANEILPCVVYIQ